MSTETYDVVVAGAGHNSLITAAYLAIAGFRVAVLEAEGQVGGNCVTDELFPGYFFDTCSSSHSQIQTNPIVKDDELGLAEYGLEYRIPDPVQIMLFPDGRSLVVHRDIEETVAEINRFSKNDADAYRRLNAEASTILPFIAAENATPGAVGGPNAIRPDRARIERDLALRAWDVVRDNFEDPNIRAWLLTDASLPLYPPDQTCSARNVYYGFGGRHRGTFWATPVGGAGSLTRSLRRLLEAHGAVVRCGMQVERLVVDGGRCAGVECTDGSRFIGTQAVVSTIHIKQLVAMAPKSAWGDSFVHDVQRFQAGYTLAATYVALTEMPRYVRTDGPSIEMMVGLITGSVEDTLSWGTRQVTGQPNLDHPIGLAHTGSFLDGGRAPSGHHTIKLVSWQPYAVYGLPSNWDGLRDELEHAHLRMLRRYAPNISDDKIRGVCTKTPLDLERRNLHNYQGSCHGGSLFPSQSGVNRPVPGWSEHRMPIAGLYQTGATTHPGGGISGLPGRNAARVLLGDLGCDFEEVVAGVRRCVGPAARSA